MRLSFIFAAVLGIGCVFGLMLAQDSGRLWGALSTLGPAICVISLYRAIPIAAHTKGWQSVMSATGRPAWWSMLVMRWIGESINTLLPVGQVGGDVARARLVASAGVRSEVAGAEVAVDFLLGIISQAIFALMGVWALLLAAPGIATTVQVLAGVAILVALAALLTYAQRNGLFFRLAGVARKLMSDEAGARLSKGADGLDQEIARIFSNRPRLLAGFGWRLAGWLCHVGEAWILLAALGASAGLETALALESLSWVVRSIAFLIPGAIGAQEGGIVAVGMLLGLPAESALALALAKRAREIVVCGPGLVAWLYAERRGVRLLFALGRIR